MSDDKHGCPVPFARLHGILDGTVSSLIEVRVWLIKDNDSRGCGEERSDELELEAEKRQGAKRQILTPCAEHHYVHLLVARRFARSHNTNNPTPDNSPIVAESIIIRSDYLPDDKPLSKLTKVSDLGKLPPLIHI